MLMDKKILKRALINSFATALYVVAIGMFMSHAEQFFGKQDKPWTPVVVLMLLVASAAITGSLLFGLPAMWYVDGKKKQALQLLSITLGLFVLYTLLAVLGLALT